MRFFFDNSKTRRTEETKITNIRWCFCLQQQEPSRLLLVLNTTTSHLHGGLRLKRRLHIRDVKHSVSCTCSCFRLCVSVSLPGGTLCNWLLAATSLRLFIPLVPARLNISYPPNSGESGPLLLLLTKLCHQREINANRTACLSET